MQDRELILMLFGLVRQAEQAILAVYRSEFKVSFKKDNSPLTAADMASHRIITEGLRGLPYAVISEEGDPGGKLPPDEPYWLLDPLDGTKGFVNRTDDFTINIALMKQTKPYLGMIYLPVGDVLFFNLPGQGAYRVCGARAADKLFAKTNLLPCGATNLSEKLREKSPLVLARSRTAASVELDRFVARLEERGLTVKTRAIGSAHKFCLLASGEADLYIRTGNTYEWDTAAGHAIINACGKRLLVLDDGMDSSDPLDFLSKAACSRELCYAKPGLLNGGFIAF